MLQYALKRLLGAIPTLLLVIVLAFLMVHAAPGGPFDDERVLPPDTREALEAAYNLDQPLHRQFIDYLSGVVTGDLGPSYHYRDHSVSELIGLAFPVSLQLGATAMLPVLSYMGQAIAAVLTGSVVVEEIFGIPGLGRSFVTGALNRDYTLVLGIVIFYAALIVLLNLVVDLLYGVIDPRIRRR